MEMVVSDGAEQTMAEASRVFGVALLRLDAGKCRSTASALTAPMGCLLLLLLLRCCAES